MRTMTQHPSRLVAERHAQFAQSAKLEQAIKANLRGLPAPDFRTGLRRTIVTIFGPRPFDEMDRNDRIRAGVRPDSSFRRPGVGRR
jgi:hypothetical protein